MTESTALPQEPSSAGPAPMPPMSRPAPGPAPAPAPGPGPSAYAPVHRAPLPEVRKQGAWGLWWLVVLTAGIYYYVWYDRINRELAAVLGQDVAGDGQWWSQLIPVYNLIGLARTAKRLNAAHAALGSPTRVSSFVTWFWAPGWFVSQTRYLQRRINILHDVIASKTAS